MLCVSVDISSDYTQVENVIKQVTLSLNCCIYLIMCFCNIDEDVLSLQAQEKLGPVDMLVNCAGTAVAGKFEEMEVERFKVSSYKLLKCIHIYT